MTPFLQSFWMFFQIGFASKWNLMSSFGKVSQPFNTIFLSASLRVLKNLRYMEPDFQNFHIPDPNKCVVGPGDAWACPQIYRFILKSENVGQTISDPGQKLIVYTLPSIWQYVSLFPKCYTNTGILSKQTPRQIVFFCIVLPTGIAYWPLLFRCGITAPCYSGVE